MSDRLISIFRGRFAPLLVAGLLVGTVPHTALGQEFCSEPVAPYCVDKDSEFDSAVQINRCEEDLSEHEEQLTEYEQCITEQLDTMRKDLDGARKKLEEARKNF